MGNPNLYVETRAIKFMYASYFSYISNLNDTIQDSFLKICEFF